MSARLRPAVLQRGIRDLRGGTNGLLGLACPSGILPGEAAPTRATLARSRFDQSSRLPPSRPARMRK